MVKKRKKITVRKSFSGFKLPESYMSLILGAMVVLVIGILFVVFAKGNRTMQTSSTNEGPSTDVTQDESSTSSVYTIKPGDDLWSISEDVYKDGYKWIEIAKVNKLEDPGVIHIGNKLTIPTIAQEKIAVEVESTPKAQSTVMQNNSITTNTYKIKEGDNLWDICVRAYGDGFKWSEIAKTNNILNPDLIYPDNFLKIPR